MRPARSHAEAPVPKQLAATLGPVVDASGFLAPPIGAHLAGGLHTESLEHILRSVRTHLGMDVGFISEFTEGRRVFRHVESADGKTCIEVGDSDPLEDSYCFWIAQGKLPQLIRDPDDHPFTASFAATKSLPVGAHLSVPIRLRNGEIYGTFCCFSSHVDPSLTDRDLAVMRAFAQLAEQQIQQEIDRAEAGQSADDRQSFERLVQAIVDYAIYMLDPTGRIVTCSAAAERNAAYRLDDVVGRNFEILYTTEDRLAGKPQRALRIATRTGRYEEEGWRIRPDESRMFARVVIDPVRDDAEKVVGFAYITRDISQRKDIEQQLFQAQKMESVGHLTGGIAHDFNNVLSVVIGNLDLLAENLEGEPQTLAFEALTAATQGAGLIKQLLAFSRNEVLQPELLKVSESMSRTESLVRRALGGAIQVDFNCESAWAVKADPSQLESAIINLAVNARDAMPDGGMLSIGCSDITLGLDVAQQLGLPAGHYVMLRVVDSGSGINKDTLDRIFEPFFTTKENGKGSGLGLSMVYGFAKQSGGTVKVDSEPGKGTEVRVYLPRATERTHRYEV